MVLCKMVTLRLQHRIRSSFVLFAITGLVLCSLISLASSGASPRRERFVLPRSSNNYDYDGYASRRSPPPPTTDRDAHEPEPRGDNGRTLIFKSLILAPLAMVVFILLVVLFVPIPVISQPIGRSMQAVSSFGYASSLSTIKMARDVLASEECIERVSCELSKLSRSHESTSWIPSALEKLLIKAKWSEKIIRGLNGVTSSACSQFACTPAKHLKRTTKNATVAQ